jgi:hypothetical protein
MGTSVGTRVFLQHGWRAAAAINLALLAFQMFALLLRGPHYERFTWFGYEGGLEARKSMLEKRALADASTPKPNLGTSHEIRDPEHGSQPSDTLEKHDKSS